MVTLRKGGVYMDKLLTVLEIAELLNVTKTTIYNMIYKNEIPFIRIGGSYRFNADEVIEYFKKGGKNRETNG